MTVSIKSSDYLPFIENLFFVRQLHKTESSELINIMMKFLITLYQTKLPISDPKILPIR